MNNGVSELDARAMIKLAADVAGLSHDVAVIKRYLMEGLSTLIGADCWAWTLARLQPGRPLTYVGILHGGFTEARFVRLVKASDHPDMAMLMVPFSEELAERKRHITRLRQQFDPEFRLATTDAYRLWLEADIGPVMFSGRPLAGDCVSLVCIYRSAAKPLFTERERRMAHIVLAEVPWLHASGWPNDMEPFVPFLSIRCRQILTLLLEGHDRNTVAAHLKLSVHTIGDYVKEIYRTFSVNSHIELMARFRGDRNDLEKF